MGVPLAELVPDVRDETGGEPSRIGGYDDRPIVLRYQIFHLVEGMFAGVQTAPRPTGPGRLP